jgi:hypothetical protein
MREPSSKGPASRYAPFSAYFSPPSDASASPARVDGWCQVRLAFAARRAPSGQRQGGPWGSKT